MDLPLGKRVQRLRRQRGLTQKALGALLGQTQQRISAWERGYLRIPVAALPTLTQALGLRAIDELFASSVPPLREPMTTTLAE